MEQTLVRPSTLKAKKATPTEGWTKPTHGLRKRPEPMLIPPLSTKELDRFVIDHGPFAEFPLPNRGRGFQRPDEERLELYRRFVLGQTITEIAEAAGMNNGNVGYIIHRVPLHFEVVR